MTLVIPKFSGQIVFSLGYTGDPQPMAMTLGVTSTPDDLAQVQDIVERFATAFADNIMPELSDVITLRQTELRFQLEDLPAPPVIVVSTTTASGEETGGVVPQNTAYLLHKRTGVGGRGGRGRWYAPGVRETDVDALGNIDAGKVTAWNAALAAFLADVNVATDPPSAASLLHDSEGAYAEELPYPVTVMTCDAVCATQRRRLRP